jgi:hypothetical protein
MFEISDNKNEKVEVYLQSLESLLSNMTGFLGCYLAGSYPYGYYVEGISDIDIIIIFSIDNFAVQQAKIESHARGFDIETDISLFSTRDIHSNPFSNRIREYVWTAKIANALLCGEDVLANFQLPDKDNLVMMTALKVIDHLKDMRENSLLAYSFDLPDIDDSLKGFITIRNGEPSLKQLGIVATWMASAFLARDFSIYTASKNAAVAEYRKRYSDGEEMFLLLNDCKKKWKYSLPTDKVDLERLKNHCEFVSIKADNFMSEFAINV